MLHEKRVTSIDQYLSPVYTQEKPRLGEIDIHNIHPIYRFATEFSKLAFLPFQFKVDTGGFETVLAISDTGKYRTYVEKDSKDFIPFVPDIIDYKNKIVIEYEEETGDKRAGAKLARKGHGHQGDHPTKRDEIRNHYYSLAGFKVLRVWESQYESHSVWRPLVAQFLISCLKNKTETMTILNKIPNLE